jgi:hypothetical protein
MSELDAGSIPADQHGAVVDLAFLQSASSHRMIHRRIGADDDDDFRLEASMTRFDTAPEPMPSSRAATENVAQPDYNDALLLLPKVMRSFWNERVGLLRLLPLAGAETGQRFLYRGYRGFQ